MAIDWSAIRLEISEVNDDVRKQLATINGFVVANLPQIIKEFYDFVFANDPAQVKIRDREFLEAATNRQIEHWKLVASGDFGKRLEVSAGEICRMHHAAGLTPQWYCGARIMFISTRIKKLLVKNTTISRFDLRRDQLRLDLAAALDALDKAFINDLEMTIGVYFGSARELRKKAISLSSERFKAMITKLLESSHDLEGVAEKLSSSAVYTRKLGEIVADASTEASTNVRTVAAAAEVLASSVQIISSDVQRSRAIATSAVERANQTDTRIASLSQAAGRIGDVVQLIGSVAKQTSLLALNATIEAARAGDAGRGFAIVAQEVKGLSAQTGTATEEIRKQISEMQEATSDAVEFIRAIGTTIAEISSSTSTIAVAIEQQNAATGEIVLNVQNAVHGTSQVAESIADVKVHATDTGRISADLLGAAKGLSDNSATLQREIDDFLTLLAATG